MILNVSRDLFKGRYNKNPPQNSLAISIMNSSDNLLDYFEFDLGWRSTLRLIFDDISDPTLEGPEYQLFSKYHAERILEATLDPDTLEVKAYNDIIIHCTAGVSRSAAVSLFLNQLKSKNVITDLSRFNFQCYNRLVFSILLDTYNDLADKKSLPYYHERIRS